MKYSPNSSEIKQAVELLVNKYNISSKLLGQLLGQEKINKANEILKKIDNSQMTQLKRAEMLIYNKGANLFSGSDDFVRLLRRKLLERLPDETIIYLYEKHGTNSGITSPSHMRRPLSEKKWHPGGRWANDFTCALGFPEIFAGVSGEGNKPNIYDIPPREKLPELKEFQKELKEKMRKVLENEGRKTRCVVSLPTGGGKTRVAVEAFIDWMRPHFSEGKYLLWIAQSEELCEQAISCIATLWKNTEFVYPLRVYRYFGGREFSNTDKLIGGVVVSSIQQLHNRIKSGDEALDIIISKTGAMIIDEAHRAISSMYVNLIKRAMELCGDDLFPICGLSATPGRAGINYNEETKKLVDMFSKYLIKPQLGKEYETDPLLYFKKHKYLAKTRHIRVKSNRTYVLKDEDIIDSPTGEGLELAPVFLKKLANDNKRNYRIIETLKKIPMGNPILVYTCTVEQAHFLAMIMTSLGRPAGVIDSDTPISIRRGLIEDFKKGKIDFLFNFGVLTTGFDAPKTTYVVITRPTTSQILYEQMVGRGLRGPEFGGTEYCTIIDFADNIGRHGKALAYARFADYWDEDVEE